MEAGLGRFGDRRLEKGGPVCWLAWSVLVSLGISVRRIGGNRAGEIQITRSCATRG